MLDRRAFMSGIPVAALLAGCATAIPIASTDAALWYLPSPSVAHDSTSPISSRDQIASLAGLMTFDSTSLRPVTIRPGGRGLADFQVPTVVSTWQGTRYHPETIRALAGDTSVLAVTARGLRSQMRDRPLILDFQGSAPNDIPALVAVIRALGEVVRVSGKRSLAVVVPAGDTTAYPTEVLSRVADFIVVRLDGEHRPGTPPGPPASPEFIDRELGMRSRIIGASRVGAELPLFGYLWNRDGTAAPITFIQAQSLVRSESGVFTRDPPSQFLTARGRDGWTLWVPDARTVEAMQRAVGRRGITWIALAGPEGADPAIYSRPFIRR